MKNRFRLYIVSLKGVLFDEQVESVYLCGDDGEFELLPFHRLLLASLPEGEIKIAGYDSIAVKVGVLMFNKNECNMIVEESPETKVTHRTWDQVAEKE